MQIVDILKQAKEKSYAVKWNINEGSLLILAGKKDENVHIAELSEVNADFLKLRFPLRIALIPISQIKEITYNSLDEGKIY